jgi:L-ribulose-5-phosphate 4-epimerase
LAKVIAVKLITNGDYLMLEELKNMVCDANKRLETYQLVTFTWGNVSGFDYATGLVVIKPSGVPYKSLTPDMMVVVNLAGKVIEGDLRPSSDTPTHVLLYRKWGNIGGIVHTHSTFATSWAQAGRDIPCYGTTQADYFFGSVPCTRALSKKEVESAYEENTGRVILERFKNLDWLAIPGTLCKNHGVFSWGKNPNEALYHAKVIEEVAHMAAISEFLNPNIKEVPQFLLDKHYNRKHGPHAYYGQE